MVEFPRKADGRRVFSVAFKRETVGQITSGEKTLAELSRELGISPSVIRNWMRLVERGGTTAVAAGEDVVPASRVHHLEVCMATIQRIFQRLGMPYLPTKAGKQTRRPRQLKLFEKAEPGESVQIDTKVVKIAGRKAYQYTALDDCTRYRLLRLFPRLHHGVSTRFLETVRREMPFAIRHLQCDHGTEFPLAFELAAEQTGMRLRCIRPRCPQQNGKVERSHRIDSEEFWSRLDVKNIDEASTALHRWERQYNHDRFSVALGGLTPAEKLATKITPVSVCP